MNPFCKAIMMALVLLGLCKASVQVAAASADATAKQTISLLNSAETPPHEDDTTQDDDATHVSETTVFQYTFQDEVLLQNTGHIQGPVEEVASPPPQE